jgi:hypothetical protein
LGHSARPADLDEDDQDCAQGQGPLTVESHPDRPAGKTPADRVIKIWNQADEEIRTLDPLLGKEMLYH